MRTKTKILEFYMDKIKMTQTTPDNYVVVMSNR